MSISEFTQIITGRQEWHVRPSADELLAGERLQRPCPASGELTWGIIQFAELSPYYNESTAGIERAFWVADDGSFTDYILVDDISLCLGCRASVTDNLLTEDASLCPDCVG